MCKKNINLIGEVTMSGHMCMCGGCEDCLDAQQVFGAQFRALETDLSNEATSIDWFPEDY